ncbi:MAG: hypothetical protein ACTSSP_03695 [Candidatus Asgardarchaeia archaeon]
MTLTDVFDKNSEDGITNSIDSENPLTINIAWNSIPEAKNYTVISQNSLALGVNVIPEEATYKHPKLLRKT